MHLDLTTIEHTFEAADGKIRSFRGCSLSGLMEFNERMDELRSALEPYSSESLQDVYLSSVRVRWLCDRLLELNGIQPHWVTPLQLSELLFNGLLLQVNRLKQSDGESTSEQPLTTPQLIAQAMLVTGGDVEAAIALVEQLPAQMAIDLIEAIVDTRKTPEEKQQDDFQEWKRKKMERFQQ
jgi:hypothetical protein